MKTIEIGKHRVEIFDSIEDLPVIRYHKYQKLLLIDSGIGGDVSEFDRKTERIRQFIATGDSKNAQKELDNLRMMIYFVQTNVSPKLMSFAVMVASIDGKKCDDLSDDGLHRVIDTLQDTPFKRLIEILLSVKKKIDHELRAYFPDIFDSVESKEFYDMLRERTMTLLRNIEDGMEEPETEEVKRLTSDLVTFEKPGVFSGRESAEITFDKNFETVCLMLSENTSANPKQMTVLEYYNAYEYAQNRARQMERNRAKNKR